MLAEIYSQALERHGSRSAGRSTSATASSSPRRLSRALVELVPEYAGTALDFRSLGTAQGDGGCAVDARPLGARARGTDVTALASAPAQDANTFVVTRATADREGLRTLSDLARRRTTPFVRRPTGVSVPARVPRRAPTGLRAKFKEFVGSTPAGRSRARHSTGGYVDVALLFTTDPAIARGGLVELVDDRGLQPAENVIPLIRTELVDRFGARLVRIIDGVSPRLTTEALGRLNGEVAAGAEPARVAARWLRTERRP